MLTQISVLIPTPPEFARSRRHEEGRLNVARLRAALHWLASEDPETGWLVRGIGTIALVVVLLTTRPHSTPGWVWPVYAVAFACWLIFVGTDPRLPRLSIWALGAASTLPTVAFGAATDGTPVLLCAITLGVFVTHTAHRPARSSASPCSTCSTAA